MKAYLIVTGATFALVAVAHVLRMIFEDGRLALDPWYVALTVGVIALSAWAWRLLFCLAKVRRGARPADAKEPGPGSS